MMACAFARRQRSPARAHPSRSTLVLATPVRPRLSRSTIPPCSTHRRRIFDAYPVETVVAEKFEALVTLGVANSRLKDFYDLWVISRTFELRRAALVEAVQRTFERRGTVLPSDTPVGLTDEFAGAWATQWRAFLGRNRMAVAPDAFAATVADLRVFLMPLIVGLREERLRQPSGPKSLGAAIDEA